MYQKNETGYDFIGFYSFAEIKHNVQQGFKIDSLVTINMVCAHAHANTHTATDDWLEPFIEPYVQFNFLKGPSIML